MAVSGKKLKKTAPSLWEILAIPASNPNAKPKNKIEGDLDIIVINKKKPQIPCAILSCKTSVRERVTETAFYAQIWKKRLPSIRVILVTSDAGVGGFSAKKWVSEWGTRKKPTKARSIAETYLDGVYSENPKTRMGGKIKHVKNLGSDLKLRFD